MKMSGPLLGRSETAFEQSEEADFNKGSNRTETTLPRTKFDVTEKFDEVFESEKRCSGGGGRGVKKKKKNKNEEEYVMVSARKLAAGIWKSESASRSKDQRLANRGGVGEFGFQYGDGCGGSMDFITHGNDGMCVRQSPHFGRPHPKSGYLSKTERSFQNLDSEEAVTKWDPVYLEKLGNVSVSLLNGYIKPREQHVTAAAVVSAMELKLEQAQARIHELEHVQKSSKKKLESFLRNISVEKAALRSREHEKIRALLDDMKADLNQERKYRQRLEVVNSKLANELAEAKLSVKRYMQEYEKEREGRELVEEVCEELAKEVEDDKEQVDAIREECLKIQEEAEDDRKMLQMAEVWREERVQMKLVDIKIAAEEKYSQINQIVAGLESFLKSRNADFDSREIKGTELLCQAAASLNKAAAWQYLKM